MSDLIERTHPNHRVLWTDSLGNREVRYFHTEAEAGATAQWCRDRFFHPSIEHKHNGTWLTQAEIDDPPPAWAPMTDQERAEADLRAEKAMPFTEWTLDGREIEVW